jgi:hypothetical protein
VIISGRRGGKSLAQRTQVLAAVADGAEVHVAGRDGLWRVMPTGIGPLWEKIRQPCPDRRRAPWPGDGYGWARDRAVRRAADALDRSELWGEWLRDVGPSPCI